MQQDNTLGAPTEGLGQSVTFKVSDSNGISQLQPVRLSDDRSGIVGGAPRNTGGQLQLQDAREGGQILELLGQLGGAVLQPKIEEARRAAFLDGVRQVATGTAVKEIVDEQPWYSQVFGPTPVVEGARAYASFNKVQEEALAVEQAMPELRKQSPQEFQKYIGARMAAATTGDPGTDALVSQSYIKELPGLMKSHAKEHIGWQQQQFAEQTRNTQITAAALFSAKASKYNSAAQAKDLLVNNSPAAFTDENDILEAKIKFSQAFAPVPGIPPETHAKMTTQVVSDLLSQRNLRAYYTLAEAGALDERLIGPDNAKKLREQADRSEARARAEMPQPLIDAMVAIKAMPELYDQEGINTKLKDAIANINAAHMQYTGGNEPLIEGNTASELRASLVRNQVRDERRVLKAEEDAKNKLFDQQRKAAEKLAAAQGAAGMMLRGEPTNLISGTTKEVGWDVLRGMGDKLHSARAASFHLGDVDKAGQGAIRSSVQNALDSNNPDEFERQYQEEYLPMVRAAKGSEHVAKAYFGMGETGFADVMGRYHELRKNAKSPTQIAAAYSVARTQKPKFSSAKDSPDQKGIAEVQDRLDGRFGFGRQVDDRFSADIWAIVKNTVVDRPGSLGDNVAAAIGQAQQNGLEFTGKYYWQADEPKGLQRELEKLSNDIDPATAVKDQDFGDVVNAAVDAVVTEQGIDPSNTKLIFHRGANKQQSLLVLGIGRDGVWNQIFLTPAEILSKRQATSKKEDARVGRKPLALSN